MNFLDFFQTILAKFRDCFWTVLVKIYGLISKNPDKIFGTVFNHSRTVLRFGFDPETYVFGFCGVF